MRTNWWRPTRARACALVAAIAIGTGATAFVTRWTAGRPQPPDVPVVDRRAEITVERRVAKGATDIPAPRRLSGESFDGYVKRLLAFEQHDGLALCGEFEDSPANAADHFEARRVDLNRDGRSEVLAKAACLCAGCSATGNCLFWVFAADGDSAKPLLSAGDVQQFRVLESSRYGYRDLELVTHDSAFDSVHIIYRFDGSEYQEAQCSYWSYRYLDDRGGNRDMERPRIEPCGQTT